MQLILFINKAVICKCFNLLTIDIDINFHLVFLLLYKKKVLLLYAKICSLIKERLIYCLNLINQFCHMSIIFPILHEERDLKWYINVRETSYFNEKRLKKWTFEIFWIHFGVLNWKQSTEFTIPAFHDYS